MFLRIQNPKVIYDLEVTRSVSIIRGNSGSGKSYLTTMLMDYARIGKSSGVTLSGDRKICTVLADPEDYDMYVSHRKDMVVLIDEDVDIKDLSLLLRKLKDAGAWVLLVTRKDSTKKYTECTVDSVYEVITSGKYRHLRRLMELRTPNRIMGNVFTEDRGSGNIFFNAILGHADTLGGKGNFAKLTANEVVGNTYILDCAVLGTALWDVYTQYKAGDFEIIPMESFEEFLLNSPVLDTAKGITEIRTTPDAMANNPVYYSWETYYEDYLCDVHFRHGMVKYSKSMRPICYLDDCSGCDKYSCQLRYRGGDKVQELLRRRGLEWMLNKYSDTVEFDGKRYSVDKICSALPSATVSSYSSKYECAKANVEMYVKLGGK